jgi:hypothetical protein
MLACCAAAAVVLAPVGAQAKSVKPKSPKKSFVGAIVEFECGDNCYLTLEGKDGRRLRGLCRAKACDPWGEEGALPANLKGKRVEAALGQGDQIDGNGAIAGRMLSFTRLRFLP